MNSSINNKQPTQKPIETRADASKVAPVSSDQDAQKKQKTAKEALVGQLGGLDPDEIAARILGIVDEHEDDENFDLEASKFWYQAAYKDQLSNLFQEKNRMCVLVNQLTKRGYTETEIYDLFTRVRKAKLLNERTLEEAAKKSELLKKKIMHLGMLLVTVFIVGQLFFKSNEYALAREKLRIAKVRTLLCEINKPPLQTKTDFDAQWNENVGLTTGIQEGMLVKTTTGAHKIKISDKAIIVFDAAAIFKVENVTLDLALKKVVRVDINIQHGIILWNLAEDSGVKLNFVVSGASLAVSYGTGKIDLTRRPGRVAVEEGETNIGIGKSMSRPLNGLMEAILSDPPEIKIYDSY